jgi:hypothetical protein
MAGDKKHNSAHAPVKVSSHNRPPKPRKIAGGKTKKSK